MKVLLILFFAIFLTSCSSGRSYDEDQMRKIATGKRVFDGDPEPKYPDDPDDTLEGVDSDKDGVRDDLEIWINETFKTYNERMAMKQLARASQRFFLDPTKQHEIDEDVAFNCLYMIGAHSRTDPNNKLRLEFYGNMLASSKRDYHSDYIYNKIGGSYGGLPNPGEYIELGFDKVCEFKVANQKEIYEQMSKNLPSFKKRIQKHLNRIKKMEAE